MRTRLHCFETYIKQRSAGMSGTKTEILLEFGASGGVPGLRPAGSGRPDCGQIVGPSDAPGGGTVGGPGCDLVVDLVVDQMVDLVVDLVTDLVVDLKGDLLVDLVMIIVVELIVDLLV